MMVYGGSFNPPHVGHAMVAAWLLWTDKADEVWLVPTFRHAFDKDLAPFRDRVELCRAMARDVDPRIRVEPIEAELPAPSFTLNTLQALCARWPHHRFRLVVGADVLGQVHHWMRWDIIQARFSPLVVGRGGYPPVPGPIFPAISSSEIRARLARGESIAGWVTRGVAEGLHRLGAATSARQGGAG